MSFQLNASLDSTAVLDEPSFSDAGPTTLCRGAEASRFQEGFREREVAPSPEALTQAEEAGTNHDATSQQSEAGAIPKESAAGQYDSITGLYLRDIGRVKPLTRQQEIELSALVKRGNGEARDQMIKANLGLVITIARGYEGLGVPLLDLISEGNLGLLKAVERFDPSKGAKFSGYGARWIKQAITRALARQAKAVRLPTHVAERLNKMRRAAWRLREEFGREPTDEELAAELGLTPRQISEMRMASSHPVSLDEPIEEEDSPSYAEIIADDRARTPYEKLEDKAVLATLQDSFRTLDRREKAVLRSRFGLNGARPRTLEKIGQRLSLTDERVRQIQDGALKKLRRRINNLENYGAIGGATECRRFRAPAAPWGCR
jgi:RNA polymerase primary sigma factor